MDIFIDKLNFYPVKTILKSSGESYKNAPDTHHHEEKSNVAKAATNVSKEIEDKNDDSSSDETNTDIKE
mgnify:CR=1 FL=1